MRSRGRKLECSDRHAYCSLYTKGEPTAEEGEISQEVG
jgi:hypothetical protein